ncbi:MAG: NHLP bacteriocin export ABC transporter permease/ATPase subunit [Planctomycetes bacterium]|nr:NHLP bacteriocin export ABC transporter permease/ATPase subunit [Planctomycetota bacterium]
MEAWKEEGLVQETAGNRPLLLEDPSCVWIVETGEVDAFLVRVEGGEGRGPRTWLYSAEPGGAFLGGRAGAGGAEYAMLAVGRKDARLRRLPLARFRELSRNGSGPAAARVIERYLEGMGAAAARLERIRVTTLLEPGASAEVGQDALVGPQRAVVWVEAPAGRGCFAGRPELALGEGTGFFPLPPGLWLAATAEAGQLAGLDTPGWMARDREWTGLECFRSLALRWTTERVAARESAEQERLLRKAELNLQTRHAAIRKLSSSMQPEAAAAPTGGEPLLAACRVIGRALRVELSPPPPAEGAAELEDPLAGICRVSRVRYRRILLDPGWWRTDAGPLLCADAESGAPVVALPTRPGRYAFVDAESGARTPVDAASAARLAPDAHTFYRPFPDRKLTPLDLVKFILPSMGFDLSTALFMSVLAGGLAVLTPLATGELVGVVLPGADTYRLAVLLGVLVVAAFVKVLLDQVSAFAYVRIESLSDSLLQSAVMDRLLRLPATFFRQFTVGDLSERVMGPSALREVLSGSVAPTLLGLLVATPNFLLLFCFSASLALVALAIIVGTMVLLLLLSWWSLRYQTPLQQVRNKLAGVVFEIVNGVAKLRVTGAEDRAFARWTGKLEEQNRLAAAARVPGAAMMVLGDLLDVVPSLILFAMIGFSAREGSGIRVDQVVPFLAAFGVCLGAGMSLSGILSSVLSIGPLLEMTQPILSATPETDASRPPVGRLSGAIQADHLFFRYKPGGPLILDDISFRAEPGQFLAFVGPSGSGKSTVMRQLLGFETPESGTILFDAYDTAKVDLGSIRRQLGVVLQSTNVLPGSIFENIIGSSLLTVDDAWAAAEMAGLADDVRKMPMGMHTVVCEGGGTLSGGQRQRMLIARALVRRPRILLFDEATSALDNRTQEIVSKSLEAINATRIVIAHRLSTVRYADCIYVVKAGKVIEKGTYDELVAAKGLFADMAARQTL